MSKARVTISRKSTQKGEGRIHIEIEDEKSGLVITEVNMSYSDFTEALTGMASVEALVDIIPTEWAASNYNKSREVKTIYVPFNGYGDDKSKLDSLIAPYLMTSWMVWDDGTRSQQNSKEGHKVILYRFV